MSLDPLAGFLREAEEPERRRWDGRGCSYYVLLLLKRNFTKLFDKKTDSIQSVVGGNLFDALEAATRNERRGENGVNPKFLNSTLTTDPCPSFYLIYNG